MKNDVGASQEAVALEHAVKFARSQKKKKKKRCLTLDEVSFN